MADHATPNLPARDLAATSAFYRELGFHEVYRDDGWMILSREHHPGVLPAPWGGPRQQRRELLPAAG